MAFINTTPHDIVVYVGGYARTFPKASPEHIARVATKYTEMYSVEGIPVVVREFGDIENLPKIEDTYDYDYDSQGNPWIGSGRPGFILVSSIVLEAAKQTGHPLLPYLLAPDTGPTAVRNENGQVIAVTRFVCG